MLKKFTLRRTFALMCSCLSLLLPLLSSGKSTDYAPPARASEYIAPAGEAVDLIYSGSEAAPTGGTELTVQVTSGQDEVEVSGTSDTEEIPEPVASGIYESAVTVLSEQDAVLSGKEMHLLTVQDDSGELENGADVPETDDSGEAENGADAPVTVEPEVFVYYAGYYKVSDNRHYKVKLSYELQQYTWEKCREYGVPYKVIMGIMGVESGWTADIGVTENKSGTYVGLGMLSEKYNADYFYELGIDIYEPEGNIEALCSAFRDKLELFDFNIHYALIAYNQGNGGARSFIASGKESSSYSRLVIQYSENLLTQEEYDAID